MPSSDPEKRLRDILRNIERIREYMSDRSLEEFARDSKTQDAVERRLERISEAARTIGDALDATYPDVEFAKLRQLGSVLRHDYDDVAVDLVWGTADRLRRLEAACRKELGRNARTT